MSQRHGNGYSRTTLVQRADTLLVLTYHAIDEEAAVISVPPALFRRQMQTLAHHGIRGVSLAEAFRAREESGRFPADAVALTFDDGYLSVLEQALPALRTHGFGATAFVVSGLVGMRREEVRAVNRDVGRDMLGWDQLAELAASGFEIGSHSVTHPDLRRLDQAALERELAGSREDLRQRLNVPVEALAYPYGRLDRSVRQAAAKHYRVACTTRLGRHRSRDDRLRVRRVDTWYLRRPALFERLATGGLDAYLAVRQAGRDLKRGLRR